MNIKKLLPLLLIAVMAVVFVACNDDESPTPTQAYATTGTVQATIAKRFPLTPVSPYTATLTNNGNGSGTLTFNKFRINEEVEMGGGMKRQVNVSLEENLTLPVTLTTSGATTAVTGKVSKTNVETTFNGMTQRITLSGDITGTLAGDTLRYTIAFPADGWEGMPLTLDFAYKGVVK
ncbi:MAG: hypothetical protein HUK01_10055 [Bacteroidaceae bacterium]|nr:hypothetical protein [Bacteroidaceae bacterium]